MSVKLISLFAIIGKQLFSPGIQRGSGWAIVQPIEVIGSIKDQRRICGSQDICDTLKSSGTGLGWHMAASKKGVGPPADQDRTSQGDNCYSFCYDANPHAPSVLLSELSGTHKEEIRSSGSGIVPKTVCNSGTGKPGAKAGYDGAAVGGSSATSLWTARLIFRPIADARDLSTAK